MSSTAKRDIATIPDVARAAGVSPATAARALGGYGSVRPTTREKVVAAAAELGYRANNLARSMITGSTNTLGVVLADIENAFFHRAFRGIADAASQRGYEVILTNTDEDLTKEHAAVAMLAERRVDGLIVCPTDAADRSHLTTVMQSGTPVVLLDRRISGLRADTVGIDNRAAAKAATRYLIAAGHKRIGVLTGASSDLAPRLSRPNLAGVERLGGDDQRSAHRRLPRRVDGCRYHSGAGIRDVQRLPPIGRDHGTKTLLRSPEPPTAILAFDSTLSLGALQALRELGLRCPDDVSLLGFDDAEWADVVSPPLTVVAQPVYDIGARAAELLIGRVRGETRRPIHERMPTSIIERDSVGPPSL